ncbi:uncharacterized protein [Heterodontus francisci]|uniref:uncharacterized protein n=1 Tax=Heterodontus francisci TaxID=7792 RepID=UPI00355BFA51
MRISSCFTIAFISQVCAQTNVVSETRKYVYGAVFDTILLNGNIEVKTGQNIQWSFIDRTHKTLMLFHSVDNDAPTLSAYYQHRCTYNSKNGSLELRRLEVSDIGVYQLSVEGYYTQEPDKLYIYLIFLDVEEVLSTPLIIQDPAHIANNVQLSCIVRRGRPLKLLWRKGNEQIHNSSQYTLASDNSTLSISNVAKAHCGLYTCTVMNDVSWRNISHVLIVQEVQFLHKRILIASVIAMVSTLMSFAAISFIIFFGIERYKAQKYQMRLTVAFLFIEMKCYICLLVSSILCTLDSDFLIGYRAVSGIVFCLLFGMTGYIVFLFLRPRREDISSFLLNKRERYIILGSGVFTIIISPLPIYEASENGRRYCMGHGERGVKRCTLPYGDIAAAVTTAVMVYVSTVGLGLIFAIKNMQTWNLERRSSRLWTR